MANELSITYTGSNTVYAIIRKLSDSKVWSVTGAAFVTWSDGSIGDYDIVLTDRGGDLYSATFPSAISTGIEYRVNYYEQAGASPAVTDIVLIFEEGYWNGEVLSTSYTSPTSLNSGLTYSSLADVELILPQKMTDRKNSPVPSLQANLTDDEIEEYILRADREIDAYLEQYYEVPLRRIKKQNPNAVGTSVLSTYPDPIPFCSARLAAAYLVNEKFASDGSSNDGSKFGEKYQKDAMAALGNIISGVIMLPGQLYKGHRYLRPESRNSTAYPVKQNPSGGGGGSF